MAVLLLAFTLELDDTTHTFHFRIIGCGTIYVIIHFLTQRYMNVRNTVCYKNPSRAHTAAKVMMSHFCTKFSLSSDFLQNSWAANFSKISYFNSRFQLFSEEGLTIAVKE